jgi:hypothetical protein
MAEESFPLLNQIQSLAGEGMKVATVRDAAGRPETTYEASLNTEIGESCLVTRYKYADGALGTSRKVIAYEEEVLPWPGYEAIAVGAGNDFNLIP